MMNLANFSTTWTNNLPRRDRGIRGIKVAGYCHGEMTMTVELLGGMTFNASLWGIRDAGALERLAAECGYLAACLRAATVAGTLERAHELTEAEALRYATPAHAACAVLAHVRMSYGGNSPAVAARRRRVMLAALRDLAVAARAIAEAVRAFDKAVREAEEDKVRAEQLRRLPAPLTQVPLAATRRGRPDAAAALRREALLATGVPALIMLALIVNFILSRC